MALSRLILLVVLLGSFTALAVQNTALLPLVILGQRTISLPLWAWLAGALLLGGLTSVFLSGVIQWTAFWSRRDERKMMRTIPTSSHAPARRWRNPWNRQSQPTPDPTHTHAAAQPRSAASQRSAYQPPAPPQEVVDADFRVIRPPSRSLEDES
jgi:uncharacterized integral membrane protein